MFTNISRSYGISITNRCTFRMNTTSRNAVSFWISFNKANFNSRQLICTFRTFNHNNSTRNGFYFVKDTDNIIKSYFTCTSTAVGADTYTEIHATYSIVQPDTLYHIITAVSPDNKTGLTGSVISQNNGVWINGVPYFNTSIFGAGTANYYTGLSVNQFAGLNFGNYLTNFNIFDLVIKNTDEPFTIAECQNLYNGGQGINLEGNDAILQLNQIGSVSGGLRFISKIGNFLLKDKFKTEFISSPSNSNQIVLGNPNTFYGVTNTTYTQRLISSTSSKNGFLSILTNTGCSIPVTYYDDSANRQPYRNGNIVKHQVSYYELPQVPVTVNGKTYNDQITPYFYDGVSHIYVYNISDYRDNYTYNCVSPTAKEVTLDRVSITGSNCDIQLVTATGSFFSGGISSKNLFAYTITNCVFGEVNRLFIQSGGIETDVIITSTNFSLSTGIFFTRFSDSIGFKSLNLTSCVFNSLFATPTAIGSYNVPPGGGAYDDYDAALGPISITSFTGYVGFGTFTNQRSITSFICTPTSVKTGGLSDPALSFYNCSNLSNITITSNYLQYVTLPNISILTTLSLSGIGLTAIGLVNTGLTAGQIVLPPNNTITNLSISNSSGLTSINRIPTSVTALTLSGLGITGSIDLYNLTNLTNINITNNQLSQVILPNNSILTNLNLSGIGLTAIGLTNSGLTYGLITLPSTNTITNLVINNTSCTTINRIPTSVTSLDLRNNVYLGNNNTDLINLTGLSNDIPAPSGNVISGIYLSGCSFGNITLPASRNIGYFDISGLTFSGGGAMNWWAAQGPTLSNYIPPGCTFSSGTGTVFNVKNVVWFNWGGGLPLGTRINCNTITLGGSMFAAENSFWLNTISNLYSNYTGFATSSIAKALSFSGSIGGTPSLPTNYIQATGSQTGFDGNFTTASGTASTLTRIREISYVLINQNLDGTTSKKYNWSVTL